MKKILVVLILSFAAVAGLPPPSAKFNGDTSYKGTFQTDYGTIPATRSGSQVTIGTIPTSAGGTGSTSGVGTTSLDTTLLQTAYQLTSGMSLDKSAVSVTSDGVTVTLNWGKFGGGNVAILWSSGMTTVTAGSIALTAGSDSSPTLNYCYIPLSTKAITCSTSDFPAEEYYTIGKYIVQSAPTVASFGLYGKNDYESQVWTSGENGEIKHLEYWISHQPATWDNGVLLSQTITTSAGLDSIDIAETSGMVLQVHERVFPAMDMSLPARTAVTFTNGSAVVGWTTGTPIVNDAVSIISAGTLPTNFTQGVIYYVVAATPGVSVQLALTKGGVAIVAGSAGTLTHSGHINTNLNTIFVVNSSIAAYSPYGGLSKPLQNTSTGTAITGGDRVNVVIWGAIDGAGDVKLFANLPSGYYGSNANAIGDISKFTNYSIPPAYQNSGFLIARLIYQYQSTTGGNWILVENLDLRGQFPSVVAGGSVTGQVTTFADNVFAVQAVADVTKEAVFSVGGTTGTKTTLATSQTTDKTLTFPDIASTLLASTASGIQTWLTTPSSTNLISTVTDETGTGALVFANTPTLISPLLGTPTSGVMTNVTGLPLTTGVAGVLGTSNGGTGLSTVGTETKVLKVVSGVPAYAEDDPENFLLNYNFEGGNASGVATSWDASNSTGTAATYTISTSTSEVMKGAQAQKIVFNADATGDLDYRQMVAVTAGMPKQWIVGIGYSATSTTAISICSMVDNVEVSCADSTKLILDGTPHSIEIPVVITGTTNVGIKVKSTNSTGTLILDSGRVKQGIGTQNLALDNVYSAVVSSGGAISGSNTQWLASCTNATTPVCTFTAGIFSIAPNCWHSTTAGLAISRTTSTTTTVQGEIYNTSGSVSAGDRKYFCQKQGNDYLAASASVYSQSSANTEWTSFTPTGSWSTNATYTGKKRYTGDYEEYDITIATSGAPTSASLTVNLPSTIDTSKLTSSELTIVDLNSSGAILDAGALTYPAKVYYNSSTSVKIFVGNSAATYLNGAHVNQALPIAFGAGDLLTVKFKIPIAGRSNSSSIVGTFAGTPKVPGLDGNVDTFSVSYGTTNATTACSTINTNCTYLDQIGTAVSNIFHGATAGIYTMNTVKTYPKLKCQLEAFAPGVAQVLMDSNTILSCSTCSSVTFATAKRSDGTAVDSIGNIMCQGSY